MSRRLRCAAAVLFVVAAGLFAVGVAIESDTHSEAAEPHDESAEAEGHDETGEAAGHDESAETRGDVVSESGHAEEGTVLGINTESPAAVAAAIAVSFALAVGLWFLRRRWLALVAVAFGVVFAVFDIGEITRQIDESRTGLTVLAAVAHRPGLLRIVAADRDRHVAGFASRIFQPTIAALQDARGWRSALTICAIGLGVITITIHALVLPGRPHHTAAQVVTADELAASLESNLTVGAVTGSLIFVLLNVLAGVALGALLQSSATAIAASFALPAAFALLGTASTPVADWIDMSNWNWVLENQWGGHLPQISVSVLFWVAVPLAAGVVRTIRRDVT